MGLCIGETWPPHRNPHSYQTFLDVHCLQMSMDISEPFSTVTGTYWNSNKNKHIGLVYSVADIYNIKVDKTCTYTKRNIATNEQNIYTSVTFKSSSLLNDVNFRYYNWWLTSLYLLDTKRCIYRRWKLCCLYLHIYFAPEISFPIFSYTYFYEGLTTCCLFHMSS